MRQRQRSAKAVFRVVQEARAEISGVSEKCGKKDGKEQPSRHTGARTGAEIP